MNILSLFDGISCGRIALERAGIKVDAYYASEIDRHAIKVSEANYPAIIRLGDVTKWREWNIDWSSIDILFAGFPCQSWSFSGKQLGLDDPRGQLALCLVDIFNHLKEQNPDVKFLFENVSMKKEHKDFLDNLFGCKHMVIDSNLVSAQNRKRLYWTNIPNVVQPEDKNIFVRDILDEPSVNHKFWSDAQMTKWNNHEYVFNAIYRVESPDKKCQCLMAQPGMGHAPKILIGDRFRWLSATEWEKLQTVPAGYTASISDAQRKKCLGNGWTVDIIAHILSFLNNS